MRKKTIKLNLKSPVKVGTAEFALELAPWLYSKHERETLCCYWLEAIAALGELQVMDWGDLEACKVIIGRAVMAVMVPIHFNTKPESKVMPATLWAHHMRTPRSVASAVVGARNRLAEVSTKVARQVRASYLACNQPETSSIARRPAVEALYTVIYDPAEDAVDSTIYAYAAALNLNLKDCVEAFVETRRHKLVKNGVTEITC